MKNLKIRFNTNYPQRSDKKWRILSEDNNQLLVDEVEILCKSFTTTDLVIGDDGKEVLKHHISCVSSNMILEENNSKTKAIIE